MEVPVFSSYLNVQKESKFPGHGHWYTREVYTYQELLYRTRWTITLMGDGYPMKHPIEISRVYNYYQLLLISVIDFFVNSHYHEMNSMHHWVWEMSQQTVHTAIVT